MRTTFDFYYDPGHGWLKVNTRDLFALGLTPCDFSSYSYRRGNDLYLEEDCDASTFLAAYKEKNPDKAIKFRERGARHKRSKIRSYPTNGQCGY